MYLKDAKTNTVPKQVPHLMLPSTPQNWTEIRRGPGQLRHCSLESRSLAPFQLTQTREGIKNDIVFACLMLFWIDVLHWRCELDSAHVSQFCRFLLVMTSPRRRPQTETREAMERGLEPKGSAVAHVPSMKLNAKLLETDSARVEQSWTLNQEANKSSAT